MGLVTRVGVWGRLQIKEVTILSGLPGTVGLSWDAGFSVLKLRKSQANLGKLITLPCVFF